MSRHRQRRPNLEFLAHIRDEDARTWLGTGVLVDSRHVLTCAHVVGSRRRGVSARVANRLVSGEVVRSSNERDLAVIKLDHEVRCSSVRFAEYTGSLEELKLHDPAIVGFGADQSDEPLRWDDFQFTAKAWQVDGIAFIRIGSGVSGGCSGGPLIVEFDRSVGCVGVAKLGGDSAASSLVIGAHVCSAFLQNEGIDTVSTPFEQLRSESASQTTSGEGKSGRIRSHRSLLCYLFAIAALTALIGWRLLHPCREKDVARVSAARDLLERDPGRAAMLLREVTDPERTEGWFQTATDLWSVGGIPSRRSPLAGHVRVLDSVGGNPELYLLGGMDGSLRILPPGEQARPIVLSEEKDAVIERARFNVRGDCAFSVGNETVRLYCRNAGEWRLRGPYEGLDADFSPDGNTFAVASKDGTIQLRYLVDDSTKLYGMAASAPATVVRFSAGGDWILVGRNNGDVDRFQLNSAEPTPRWIGNVEHPVTSADWCWDSQSVVVGTARGEVIAWRLETGKKEKLWHHESRDVACSVNSVSCSSQMQVLSVARDCNAMLGSLDSGSAPVDLPDASNERISCAKRGGRAGELVAVGTLNGDVQIYEARRPDRPRIVLRHDTVVNDLAFSADGRRIVTVGAERLQTWTLTGSTRSVGPGVKFAGFTDHDGGLAFGLSTGPGTGALVALDLAGSNPPIMRPTPDEIAAIVPAGESLNVLTYSPALFQWSFASGEERRGGLPDSPKKIVAAAFNATGTRAATVDVDRRVGLWDGTQWTFPAYVDAADTEYVALSEDGRTIVVTFKSGGFQVVEEGVPVHRRQPGGRVAAVTIRPDGRVIMAVLVDGGLQLQAAEAAAPAHELTDSTDPTSARFSPGGRFLAVGVNGGATALWDVRDANNPRAVGTLRRSSLRVAAVAFSSDDAQLLVVDNEGGISLWPTAPLALQAVLLGAARD